MKRSGSLGVALAALVALCLAPSFGWSTETAGAHSGRSLKGQFLVATRRMGDPRFVQSVIYMVDHTPRGAMGFIVNRALGKGPLAEFLKGFGIKSEPSDATIRIHYGGPVSSGRGFVLHTSDYVGKGTIQVSEGVSMSVEMNVLKDVAAGKGPRRLLFVMGYAGWGPQQLEGEMAREDWLTAPEDVGIIFGDDQEAKWDRVLAGAGLEL